MRFSGLWHMPQVTLPPVGGARFRLTALGPAQNDPLKRFEQVTGGAHGHWQTTNPSPGYPDLPVQDIVKSLDKFGCVVRTVNVWHYKWVHYGRRDEAMIWLGFMGLRLAHEHWSDRAAGELLLVEADGRRFGQAQVKDHAEGLKNMLATFGSLDCEVELSGLRGEKEQPLAPWDLWSRLRSCEITVRVLRELAREQQRAASPFVDRHDTSD